MKVHKPSCCVFAVLAQLVVGAAVASDNLDVGSPGGCDQVVDRVGYALGYSEKHEQAAWVQYRLTREENQSRWVARTDDFREDPAIRTGSATLDDYRRSGYNRGHLAPAGDMMFSEEAMSESFYLSNISPQVRDFDGGIWDDIEKFVRYTVNVEKSVFVITGPVFGENDKRIGPNKVTVPSAFYKIIYDETPPRKMIAFIVPNEPSAAPIDSFVVSVDEVEARTGLDFFPSLAGAAELERKSDPNAWKRLRAWVRKD